MPSNPCSLAQGACEAASVNVGADERQISLALGTTILVGGVLLASTRSLLTAAIGVGLIYRGMTGHCLGYQLLGISTADEAAPEQVTNRIPVGAG